MPKEAALEGLSIILPRYEGDRRVMQHLSPFKELVE